MSLILAKYERLSIICVLFKKPIYDWIRTEYLIFNNELLLFDHQTYNVITNYCLTEPLDTFLLTTRNN